MEERIKQRRIFDKQRYKDEFHNHTKRPSKTPPKRSKNPSQTLKPKPTSTIPSKNHIKTRSKPLKSFIPTQSSSKLTTLNSDISSCSTENLEDENRRLKQKILKITKEKSKWKRKYNKLKKQFDNIKLLV